VTVDERQLAFVEAITEGAPGHAAAARWIPHPLVEITRAPPAEQETETIPCGRLLDVAASGGFSRTQREQISALPIVRRLRFGRRMLERQAHAIGLGRARIDAQRRGDVRACFRQPAEVRLSNR